MNAENRAADKAALSYSLADGLTFTIMECKVDNVIIILDNDPN